MKKIIIGVIIGSIFWFIFLGIIKFSVCPKSHYDTFIYKNKSIDIAFDNIEDFKQFCQEIKCNPLPLGCGGWSCICE